MKSEEGKFTIDSLNLRVYSGQCLKLLTFSGSKQLPCAIATASKQQRSTGNCLHKYLLDD